jgi:thioredoxin-like negative regulator of GroEL/TolB-like protein
MLCGAAGFRTWAAVEVVPSNLPSRLVVAVLPFENATGDAALDDCRQAFPVLVRSCLGGAECVNLPRGKELQPSLARAGWTATKAVDAALASQVARELKANFAVWGSVQRLPSGWAVEAKVLQVDSEAAAEAFRLTEPNPVKLAECLALRLAAQWGRPVAQDQQQHWRMSVTESDAAASKLAHAVALELRQASAAEQEQAWRDVLAADPGCGMACSAPINLLADAGRNGEIDRLVEQFVRQQPRSCAAHAANSLRLRIANDPAGAEAEVREALRLHPGCSTAVRAAFNLLANSERWTVLAAILKEARASRPAADCIRILLADALVRTGDLKAAQDLLDALPDLPEEEEMVDLALLQAAGGKIELAGRELLRLGPLTERNERIRGTLGSGFTFARETANDRTNAPVVRPRRFTPAELQAELERRLSSEARELVVNPLEITPELTAEARRLAVGITNGAMQAVALFAEVARRGRGTGDGGRRTASQALRDSDDPQTRFACQEHAKLLVALARALGLEAWLVHVERCADGSPASHDCAALFLDGQGMLVDSTWRGFGILHQEFTVLDDVQAISHQAMQPSLKPDPRRLRLGLKLNPEDRWTRLQFVRGMARAGEFDAAVAELRKVQATGAETWDVHEAAAELEIARDRWKPALAELQRAVALSPSNALVHVRLAVVYGQLNDPGQSTEHMAKALQFARGEIHKDFRRESQFGLQVLNAFSQVKSGDPGSREEIRGDTAEMSAQDEGQEAPVCRGTQQPRPPAGPLARCLHVGMCRGHFLPWARPTNRRRGGWHASGNLGERLNRYLGQPPVNGMDVRKLGTRCRG